VELGGIELGMMTSSSMPEIQLSRSRNHRGGPIEEPFGWAKTIAGGHQLRHRGRQRNRAWFKITTAVYNLMRITALNRRAQPKFDGRTLQPVRGKLLTPRPAAATCVLQLHPVARKTSAGSATVERNARELYDSRRWGRPSRMWGSE